VPVRTLCGEHSVPEYPRLHQRVGGTYDLSVGWIKRNRLVGGLVRLHGMWLRYEAGTTGNLSHARKVPIELFA